MKVAIVYPEVFDLARFKEKRKEFPPFGALYLASTLEENDFSVKILKISEGATRLDLSEFEAVAFTIPSSATYGLVREARFHSLFSANCLIMIGGVHPTFYPEDTLVDLKPDIVGVGEGEETILEILEQHVKKDFSSIDGVCFIKDGQPFKTKPRTIKKNIDHLPLPARHLLSEEDFLMTNRLSNVEVKMAHVMLTRGCPFPCKFCAAARTKMQFRSGKNARVELQHLINQYGIEGFAIVDDNFIVNKKIVKDICESIKDLNLKWSALSRVDTVDEELLICMKDAGCIEIKYGMESGSESLLTAMGKNITTNQIVNAITMTSALDIKVKVFLIHGFPGENLVTTHETINLLKKVGHMIERVSLFRFVPLPGTFVYNNQKLYNLRNTDKSEGWDGDWSRYHIHHNNYHWWGTENEFNVMDNAYMVIKDFVDNYWSEIY